MDTLRGIRDFCQFALEPLSWFESRFAVASMIIASLIFAGVLGGAIVGGFHIPTPSHQIVFVDPDGQTLKSVVVSAPRWPFALGLPLAWVCLLLLIAGARLQRTLNRMGAAPKPQLDWHEIRVAGMATHVVTEPVPADKDITQAKGYRQLATDVCVPYVTVRNLPNARSPEANAYKAVATLDYFRLADERPFLAITARWLDNPQSTEYGKHASVAHLRERDLLANGATHGIELALKYKSENAWYATNDQALRLQADGRYPDYRLPNEHIRVRVTIRALGMGDDFIGWFMMWHSGEGSEITTEPLDEGDWRRTLTPPS